jgi:filamentous hemagglutinin
LLAWVAAGRQLLVPGAALVNGAGQTLAAETGSAAYQPDIATLNAGGSSGDGRQTNPSKADRPIWQGLSNAGNGVKTDGKLFYEWDYTHNDIEVYNKRGVHLGSADPITGELYKDAVPGRKLNNR